MVERNWLEKLQGWNKVQVVLWSGFFKKRYYIFEEQIEMGKSAYSSFKDTKKMSFKEVRKEFMKIKLSKLKK